MEDSGVTLTDEEVRERFSAYHEGELPEAEATFMRKRLEENEALRGEYARFRKMLSGLASLGLEEEGIGVGAPGERDSRAPGERMSRTAVERASMVERASQAPHAKNDQIDLLPDIQARLHKRSKGKFYRTRYSRRAGMFPLELLAGVVLILLLLVWVATTFITEVRPAQPQSPPQGGGPTGAGAAGAGTR